MTLLITRLTLIVNEVFETLAAYFKSSIMILVREAVTEQVSEAVEPLKSKVKELERENKVLLRKIDEIETHNRLDNLVFHGLMDTPVQEIPNPHAFPHQTLEQKHRANVEAVINLYQTRLGLELSETDISTAYRLP